MTDFKKYQVPSWMNHHGELKSSLPHISKVEEVIVEAQRMHEANLSEQTRRRVQLTQARACLNSAFGTEAKPVLPRSLDVQDIPNIPKGIRALRLRQEQFALLQEQKQRREDRAQERILQGDFPPSHPVKVKYLLHILTRPMKRGGMNAYHYAHPEYIGVRTAEVLLDYGLIEIDFNGRITLAADGRTALREYLKRIASASEWAEFIPVAQEGITQKQIPLNGITSQFREIPYLNQDEAKPIIHIIYPDMLTAIIQFYQEQA